MTELPSPQAFVAPEVIAARPAPPQPSRGLTPGRIGGYVLVGLWALVLAAIALYLLGTFSIDFFSRYGDRYLEGLWTTVSLVGLSVLFGALISVPLAIGRLSDNAFAAIPSLAYTTVFRGTPLIAQTFLVYYGFGAMRGPLEMVGLWWFFREPWYCALFIFSLHTAAYQAEILRGSIRTISGDQWEAAKALAIPRRVAFSRIILPQALIVALRPYGNEIVLMIKASAIVAVISVYDLFGQTRYIFSRTFDFQAYLWAAILYIVLVETLRRLWTLLENRLTRHLNP